MKEIWRYGVYTNPIRSLLRESLHLLSCCIISSHNIFVAYSVLMFLLIIDYTPFIQKDCNVLFYFCKSSQFKHPTECSLLLNVEVIPKAQITYSICSTTPSSVPATGTLPHFCQLCLSLDPQ